MNTLGSSTKEGPAVEEESHRIWVNLTYYIQVDGEGYVRGICAEGAFGCVLQLVQRNAQRTRFALKIPRLLADTIRENAYTVKVTEDEVANALEVGQLPGLVPVNAFNEEPLKLRRTGLENSTDPEVAAQNQHVIFVCFEKGARPRFCSVGFDHEAQKFSFHPPRAAGELSQILTPEAWKRLKTPAQRPPPEFHVTVFCGEGSAHNGANGSAALEDALGNHLQSQAWYAAVPAIIYHWATGTLQEAIGKRHLARWRYPQHFVMLRQILTGIRSLHRRRMLHGDVRPANVMSTGGLDNPALYALADYGSFGKGFGQIDGDAPNGNSMTGPGVGAQRVTPFYSPERRAGVERESADTAIILAVDATDDEGGGEYFVRLGWRTDLLEENKSVIRDDVVTKMRDDHKRLRDPDSGLQFTSPEALRQGDRLRLRDYIFEVVHAGQIDGDVHCCCRKRFARVIHERLAVYDHNEVIDCKIVNLSNYVEFRQWSAATDLYSVGAVGLYSLFCTGIQRFGMPKTVEDSTRSADSLFADLIRILESVPHFRIFWTQLEGFRFEFETFFWANEDATRTQIENFRTSTGKTLKELAFDTANQICQGAPYAKTILLQFDVNLCHFLLLMHFVMSCLHRQTHLEPEANMTGSKAKARPEREIDAVYPEADAPSHFEEQFDPRPSDRELQQQVPFAKDRVGGLGSNGTGGLAAQKALRRLATLSHYHTQNNLNAFVCDAASVPEFNPKPDVEIRQEISRTKDALEKANNDLEQAGALGKRISTQLDQVRSANATLTETLDRANRERDAALDRIRRLRSVYPAWRNELAATNLWSAKKFAEKVLADIASTFEQ